ncbi:dipeptidase [Alphaproteobacteria bacterium]|nr:dipeptidase [Alphaproteobacteria bacterium]MDA8666777.1 dipeptidase [Alphaproteobacteria bacterium]MDA8779678.1 dipeptidase [Alphaproteobacteria bacterium]MDB2406476.1 dipeptidase [Alphaproteobacteria bacterium]MDB2432375.1 dipeptidase [Alphaproteobacteria bacterium]
MRMKLFGSMAAIGLAMALVGCDAPQSQLKTHDDMLALDSHLDTPLVLDRAGFDISHRHDWMQDYAQVDLPRMIEGGLDGGFWVIYTAQGPLTEQGYAKALAHARQRSVVIDEMVSNLSDDFALALQADEAARIAASGKRVVYKSIENAYPLGTNIDLLDEFYAAGVRMVGLVHSRNNQFADSSTDKAGQKWGGLSPLGRALIKRANALGMIVDLSHAHDKALAQAIALSTTPIILSHSGAAHLYEHPRNVPDALLKKLAQSGGVIQINSLSGYLRDLNTDPRRLPEFIGLYRKYQNAPGGMRENHKAFIADRRALDEKYPPDYAELSDVMDHIFHALTLMGSDHVGIGLDWDGGGGVNGLQDVSDLPKITEALRAASVSTQTIEKIWSGNMLRLLRLAEAARTQ